MVGNLIKGRRRGFRHRLRSDAEKQLAQSQEDTSVLFEKKPDEIIHELQVHQIELEIQNEELKKAHLDLKEVNDRYIDIFDFAPVGYFILTDKALIAEVNLTGASMLGIVRKYLIQDRFRKFIVPEEVDKWDHFFLEVLYSGKQQTSIIHLKKRDLNVFCTRMTGIRMNRASGHTQIRIAISDITDWKMTEDALRESDEKFRLVVETAPDAIFIQSQGLFAYVNPATCRLFGAISTDELIGRPVIHQFHPECREFIRERIRLLYKEQQPVPRFEGTILRLDNSSVDVEVTAVSVKYAQKKGALVFARDLSQRRQAEDTIRSTLKEKEILLREVHHRVKNNLAVIISLIAMQGDMVIDEKTHELLADLESRVMTISLVHESLINKENLAEIQFKEYVDDLINQIIRTLKWDLKPHVIVEVDPVSIGLDIAIPCGLIINELITNSIKYAFPGGTPPGERKTNPCVITVSFKNFGENFCLQVSDNGIGIEGEKTDFFSSKTLGLQIVSMLATHQLRGTIKLDTRNGTAFTIKFKETERRKKR